MSREELSYPAIKNFRENASELQACRTVSAPSYFGGDWPKPLEVNLEDFTRGKHHLQIGQADPKHTHVFPLGLADFMALTPKSEL